MREIGRRDQSDVIRKVTARRRARRKITARRSKSKQPKDAKKAALKVGQRYLSCTLSKKKAITVGFEPPTAGVWLRTRDRWETTRLLSSYKHACMWCPALYILSAECRVVSRKITARRWVRRRAIFSAKCKAENEMQGQNSRAGGEESNKIAAGPVPSQNVFIFICTYFIFAWAVWVEQWAVVMDCRVVQVVVVLVVRAAAQ
jgi:hypothetical protein